MYAHDALERAVARAVQDEAGLLVARRRWRELSGEVHDDEPLFEERAAAFLEWFTFDYRAEGRDAPPIAALVAAETDALARRALLALAAAHRSVFVVRDRLDDGLLLDDLWGGSRFRVHERRQLTGLGRGEIFESRLMADVESPPRLLFTRTFCCHPADALTGIEEQVHLARRRGEDRATLLFRLLRLRLRCERYRHVSSARIYAAGESHPTA